MQKSGLVLICSYLYDESHPITPQCLTCSYAKMRSPPNSSWLCHYCMTFDIPLSAHNSEVGNQQHLSPGPFVKINIHSSCPIALEHDEPVLTSEHEGEQGW